MSIEVYPTSQLAAHTTHVSYPFHKSVFELSFRRYSHNNTPQRIDRNQEACYHHLQISIFQQIFCQITKERIDDTHFTMQTNDDIRRFVFLRSMQDTGSNIQVETRYGFQPYAGRSRYLCCTFQTAFATHFLFYRTVIIVDYI